MAASVLGRPGRIRAERRVHRRRSHSRCHPTTVSGWTSTSAAPVPSRLGQHDPKQPISPPEPRTGARASQRVELLAERESLDDQFVMFAAGQRQRANEKKIIFSTSILSFCEQRSNHHPSGSDCGEEQAI